MDNGRLFIEDLAGLINPISHFIQAYIGLGIWTVLSLIFVLVAAGVLQPKETPDERRLRVAARAREDIFDRFS